MPPSAGSSSFATDSEDKTEGSFPSAPERKLVGRPGLEPGTNDLKGRCSTIELSTLNQPTATGHSEPLFRIHLCLPLARTDWNNVKTRRRMRNSMALSSRAECPLLRALHFGPQAKMKTPWDRRPLCAPDAGRRRRCRPRRTALQTQFHPIATRPLQKAGPGWLQGKGRPRAIVRW